MLLGTLSGCASGPDAINPITWWHNLEGGPIAQKRQPPPGAAAPYPNLANVPTAPAFLPAAERDRISAALLADRTRIEQQTVLEPLPDAPTNGASDTNATLLAPASTPPSAQPAAASASLPAVSSQPASQPSPVQAPPEPASVAAATAVLPAVPLAPPPPPALAGIGLLGPPPAPSFATAQGGLEIGFAPGSSVLSAADRARLAALAHRRRRAAVAVTGFGDAKESDAAAQSVALELGLARAEAVATTLAAAGVPESALRLQAEASGIGAIVELVR